MKFFLTCCRNSKQRCPRSGFSSFGFHSLTALPVAQHTNRWLDSVLLRPRILEYGTNLRRRGLFKALPCLQCPRVNASGVCETGESVCETQGSQRCFLRKVYEDDRLLYGYQGCGDLCLSMSFFRQSVQVDFVCCNDTPFCNRF
ncbi:protein PIP-1-like isoform X1 [Acinonyx jubatus]|uniref:Protein PIP-1-like isoform X1 n=1 Tax=Acinonyx jubatus TaxID=32536 RepID=A0ABM3NGR3_ACIJB|nr:protein PIP-1-like isoform X1 [Acinonyx jubatus]